MRDTAYNTALHSVDSMTGRSRSLYDDDPLSTRLDSPSQGGSDPTASSVWLVDRCLASASLRKHRRARPL